MSRCTRQGALTLVLRVAAMLLTASPVTAQEVRSSRTVAARQGERVTSVGGSALLVRETRVNRRLSTRVETRVRNRLDSAYRPQADTTSSFQAASDQARVASSGRR